MNALVRERGFDQVFIVGKQPDSASPTAAIHGRTFKQSPHMTKKSAIDRVLMAYRPLYLQGLLLDGQYRLPTKPAREGEQDRPADRRRLTLVALTGLHHLVSSIRGRK